MRKPFDSTWEQKSPLDLNLDPDSLEAIGVALGGRGCIIKQGFLVHAWGDIGEKGDWYSSAKPVLSTLLMFAIQEGLVPSADTRIVEYGWELLPKDHTMTFRHLGAMTSGYARPEEPGAAWAYNDFAIQLYQRTLFDRVFQQAPEEVANSPKRFGALGLEDGLAFNKKRRIFASPRDFARIGWLWLQRGKWQGKDLLRADLVDDFLRPQVPTDLPNTMPAETNDYLKIGSYGGGSDHFSKAGPGIYGFNWWFNGQGARHPREKTWPDATADTFMSIGFGGNCMVMVPSLELVVASAKGNWGSSEPGSRESVFNQRLKLITAAGNVSSQKP